MRYATAAGLFVAASLAVAQNVAPADKEFVQKAATGGLMEVELGKVVASKAENADVKSFGQRMVDDHSKVNDSLKQLAASKGISLPAETDAKHKAEINKISAMSGPQFDRTYMRLMVSVHKKDIAEFNRASRTVKDPDIRKFAAETLLILKQHLQEAEKISASLGPGAAKGKGKAKP